jgi:hypothetical protein
MLVERFASMSIKDDKGMTAYEIADKESFQDIMMVLSQFTTGFLGPLQVMMQLCFIIISFNHITKVARGRVNNIVSCPLGCGERLTPKQIEQHCLICDIRESICPNNCGELKLLHKDSSYHLIYDCIARLVPCKDCAQSCVLKDMNTHLSEFCPSRYVLCPLGCGQKKKFVELEVRYV